MGVITYAARSGEAVSRRRIRRAWAAGLIALLSSHALAAHAASEVEKRTVRDLYYGEVLFHYYQQDYFAALTHLLGAQEQERIERGGDTELLRVGMELTYGLHDNAYEVFKRALDDHVTPAARDHIWLSLAEVWQRRGDLDRADDALTRIGDGLGKGGRAKQALLKAYIQMARGDNADAARILARVSSVAPEWSAYLRYNQAVALRRAGRSESANSVLDDLGKVKSTNSEVLALRDKANIALGFAYLNAQAPAAAKEVLERVRLDSPFADQALLGLGWAEFNGGNYYNALISWTELRNRGMRDATNYEARILVPYAQRRLHAYREAVEQYRVAVTDFDADLRRLDAIIAEVKNGKLIDQLLADDGARDALPEDAAGARAMPYLVDLSVSDEFQDALATYRNLQRLEKRLDSWSTDLSAFKDVAATRRVANEQVLPEAREKVRAIDARIASMRQRVARLRQRLGAVLRTYESFLRASVVTELYRRRQELQDYGVQARYAVAGLLDEMATGLEDH